MIINIKYNTVEGSVFDVSLFINDGTPDTRNVYPVKLDKFEYGSENENDGLFFCEKADLTFCITNVFTDTATAFYGLIDRLSLKDTAVDIYKNGNLYFKGFVDKNSVEGDYKKQSISVSIFSSILKLKELDPRVLSPAELLEPGENNFALLWNILQITLRKALPGISINVQSNLFTDTDVWFLTGYWQAGTQYWGDNASSYYGVSSRYKDCAELIKSILSSLGCMMIIKDYQANIYPRWYSGLTENSFSKITDISAGAVKKMDGLRIIFRYNGSDYTADYGRCGENDNFETMYLYIAGGWLPGANFGTALPVYVPDFVAGLGNGGWTFANDKVFAPPDNVRLSLWRTVANNIYANYSHNRSITELGLQGMYSNNILFARVHTVSGSAQKFIPKKIVEDYTKGVTTLSLVSVTDNIQPVEPVSRITSSYGGSFTEILAQAVNEGSFLESGENQLIITTQYPFVTGSVKLTIQGLRQAAGSNYEETGSTQIKIYGKPGINTIIILDYEILGKD